MSAQQRRQLNIKPRHRRQTGGDRQAQSRRTIPARGGRAIGRPGQRPRQADCDPTALLFHRHRAAIRTSLARRSPKRSPRRGPNARKGPKHKRFVHYRNTFQLSNSQIQPSATRILCEAGSAVVWCCGSAASQRKPRGRAAQSAPDALTAEPPALGARGIVRRRHPPEIRVISKR